MKMDRNFYKKDVLDICPHILGKTLVRKCPDGTIFKEIITEVEAYRGEEDLGCHASKGKTERTKVMYENGGLIYVYLVYGMYWMLNIVTGNTTHPQAILIRGTKNISGPGKLGKALKLDQTFYGEDLDTSNRIWIEESGIKNIKYNQEPRVGIEYAKEWKDKPWRYTLTEYEI